MLCGSECWTVQKQHILQMSIVIMRKLRLMSGDTLEDRVKMKICCKLWLVQIEDKMRDSLRDSSKMAWSCIKEVHKYNSEEN